MADEACPAERGEVRVRVPILRFWDPGSCQVPLGSRDPARMRQVQAIDRRPYQVSYIPPKDENHQVQ